MSRVDLNPAGQYADARNLSARQRLWQCQQPVFDFTSWVLDLAGVRPGMRVLDAGCGNGLYLRALQDRGAAALGVDLSAGMLAGAGHRAVLNADVTALPASDGAFGAVLAGHLLDLVPDRGTAISELRRVLADGGTCVAVTTGARHLRSLRDLISLAARGAAAGWRMGAPTGSAFSAETATAQLRAAFAEVTCVRPAPVREVIITDAAVAAGYVNSLTGYYQGEVARPWAQVAGEVCERVQAVIDAEGAFRTAGDFAAFICR